MAVDLFINIEGIKGESADAKHKEEIDVLSWSWGSSQSGTTHTGGGSGAGKVNIQDFSFTKYIDKASPTLFQFCASGKHIKTATFVARKAGDKPLEYLTIKLENILVSSVSVGGSSGGDLFTENVTLNFGIVHFEYKPQSATGAAEAANTKGWDIAKNVPV